MKFDTRELATVLAALRLAQQNHLEFTSMPHFSHGIKPLTAKQIDNLCQRVNVNVSVPEVAIYVDGGLVQNVYASERMALEVIDFDNLKAEGKTSKQCETILGEVIRGKRCVF